jgi:hypothetical protein
LLYAAINELQKASGLDARAHTYNPSFMKSYG